MIRGVGADWRLYRGPRALSPAEYARLLAGLAEDDGIAVDEFPRDGVVTQLEERMAAVFGLDIPSHFEQPRCRLSPRRIGRGWHKETGWGQADTHAESTSFIR